MLFSRDLLGHDNFNSQLRANKISLGFLSIYALMILVFVGLLALSVLSFLEQDAIPVKIVSQEHSCQSAQCQIKFQLVNQSTQPQKILVKFIVELVGNRTKPFQQEGYMWVNLNSHADSYFYHNFIVKEHNIKIQNIHISLQKEAQFEN